MAIMNKASKLFLITTYSIASLFAVAVVGTEFIINGTHQLFWGMYPKAGDFHFLFILFVMVMVLKILWLVFSEYKITTVIEKKKQYVYLMLGIAFFSLSAVDFLANYSVDMYPFGFMFIWIFLGLIFYAISKYNLISTNALLDKFFVIFVLSAVTYMFWLALFILEQMYVGPLLGESVLMLNIIITPVFVFGLIEIFKKVSTFSQTFFRTFRGKEILDTISTEITQLPKSKNIPEYFAEKLAIVFAADCHVFYKKDGTALVATGKETDVHTSLQDTEAIWDVLHNRNKFTVCKEQKLRSIIPDSYRNELIEILDQVEVEIIIPVGKGIHILLGEKDLKKRYAAEEIRFFKNLMERFVDLEV